MRGEEEGERRERESCTLTCKLPIKGGWKNVEDSCMIRFMAFLMAASVSSAWWLGSMLHTSWKTDL